MPCRIIPVLFPGTAASAGSPARRAREPVARLKAFGTGEGGSLLVFSLFILIAMMLAIGMSIDTVRFEYTRAKLQNTLDRAVLAAADLDQSLPPKDVVEDYFAKAGLSENLTSVKVTPGVNYRTVSAEADAEINTMFMDLVGIDTLSVPSRGAANETLADIEIALVLDNSGSMDKTGDGSSTKRIDLLKPAAKEFIDTVARAPEDDGTTAISIVPFSTQVTAGGALLGQYNASTEHGLSHCVTFSDSDFDTAAISPTQSLQRTMYGDAYESSSSWSVGTKSLLTCPRDSEREITPWSTNAGYLKDEIDDMVVYGATSIDLGAKWGAAMLDPSARPVVNALIASGVVDSEMSGQPFDYNRENTLKILVVMSDGANTQQWDIRDPYRDGLSPVWKYVTSGKTYYCYDSPETGSKDFYCRRDSDSYSGWWDDEVKGGEDAEQMTWPELWSEVPVNKFVNRIMDTATGTNASTLYDMIVDNYASLENDRTSRICQAAKDAGILVFTIGMDTYAEGDETLEDCASLPSYFYDVRSVDISSAFASIALQINQLRLTQ